MCDGQLKLEHVGSNRHRPKSERDKPYFYVFGAMGPIHPGYEFKKGCMQCQTEYRYQEIVTRALLRHLFPTLCSHLLPPTTTYQLRCSATACHLSPCYAACSSFAAAPKVAGQRTGPIRRFRDDIRVLDYWRWPPNSHKAWSSNLLVLRLLTSARRSTVVCPAHTRCLAHRSPPDSPLA
jgi:hypothetical protein